MSKDKPESRAEPFNYRMVEMKLTSPAIVLLFLLLSFTFVSAQKEPENNWSRIQSSNGEFSIEMPANLFYFYDKLGFTLSPPTNQPYNFAEMRLLGASANKTVMRVESYLVSGPKSYLAEIIRSDNMDGVTTKEANPDFIIRQVEQNSVKPPRSVPELQVSYITKYIASKTHLYVVSVANRGSQTEESRRFLSSIRLSKNKPAANKDEKIVSISDLKPLTIDDIGIDSVNTQDAPSALKVVKNPIAPSEDRTSAVILMQPRPSFTDAIRATRYFSGTGRLRLNFSRAGIISRAEALSPLPAGLGRSCFFAAIRIRFLPAEKEGAAVDIARVVEYGFVLR